MLQITFTLLVISIFLSQSSFAAKWRVNNNPTIDADFTSVSDAHDTVSANDTLYIEGSATTYSGITFTKPLVIIGTGYFLAQNTETQAINTSSWIGTSYFEEGAEGTIFQGMSVSGSLYLSCSDLIIRRNYISSRIYYYTPDAPIANVLVIQNYISDIIAQTSFSYNVTNTLIRNNRMNRCEFPSGGITGDLDFNVIDNAGQATITYGMNVRSNIIPNATGYFGGSSNNFENNITGYTYTEVCLATGSSDNRYFPNATSPALGAAHDGSDCGLGGGPDPYTLSGMPNVPHIYFLSAPSSGSNESGLPVVISAKTQN